MADVATRLDRERGQAGRVIALREYYEAASRGYAAELRKRGFSDAQIGLHAGLADTALTLALEPDMVRSGELENAARGASVGVVGDPRGASAELGMLGVNLIVERSVAAIRAAQEHP
jgi:creatinine amidohydrolase/Fe(II)-dependent formamide hydrolase-like protein